MWQVRTFYMIAIARRVIFEEATAAILKQCVSNLQKVKHYQTAVQCGYL